MDAFSAFEHQAWQNLVTRYQDHFGSLVTQSVEPLLDTVGPKQGVRLLDVATGPGYVAVAAARRGASVVGVDFSSGMVAEAARRYPNVAFREGDATSLPSPNESFDAVVMSFGMLHFAQPETALAEACRVLRRGGRVGFTMWANPERSIGFGIVLKAMQAHGDLDVPLPPGPSVFRFSDPAECTRALIQAGFAGPHVVEVPQVWRLPSPSALLDAVHQGTARTGALLRAQSPHVLARVRAAVEAAAKAYQRDTGGIEVPMPAVLASGTKA